MKIYNFCDWDTPFVYSTITWAVEGLTKYLDCQMKVYSYDEFKTKQIDLDTENDVYVIFEIGMLHHGGWNSKELRQKFPNAKIIVLSSDGIYYKINNKPPQVDDYNDIDLILEIMPNAIDFHEKYGANVKIWHWTTSEKFIKLAEQYYDLNKPIDDYQRKIDFIGIYAPWSISDTNCYRYHLVKFIENKGLVFNQGADNAGHQDNNFERIFKNFSNSLFTLGTSSHVRPELTRLGCKKGYRDIGMLFDSVLIYDKHSNIESCFNSEELIVPLYDYDNFESIINLYIEYGPGPKRNEILKKQKQWLKENSIDKQLLKVIQNYEKN